MNYVMNVKITDPNTQDGMISELLFTLDCKFFYVPEQYGNGHYCHIYSKGAFDTNFDLRYDSTFEREYKIKWLIDWAFGYWSGKNGDWKIKSIRVTEV